MSLFIKTDNFNISFLKVLFGAIVNWWYDRQELTRMTTSTKSRKKARYDKQTKNDRCGQTDKVSYGADARQEL